MFKKLLIALAVMVPTVMFAQKFGEVDTEAIFNAMPERATAEEQIAAASKTYEDEFSKLRDEMDKKYAEYQALDAATPQAIKDRRMQELQELSNRIQAFSEQAQQDLARQQQTLAAPIQDKITNAIKKVGADNGFTFIFPKGLAAYSGADVVDCTDMVKAALGVK
jgi:outer membrane protein